MKQPDVKIRPLCAQDRDAWSLLWREYLAFYETTLTEEVFASTFQRLLGTDDRDFNALVAEKEGRIVGIVHFLFHRHCWKIEDVCYLQDLFVSDTVRGTGVGAALIQAVYDAADTSGAPNVYWLTQDFNAPARRLYDEIGTLTPFIKYVR